MPWRVAQIDEPLDAWASGKSEQERLRLLSGLVDLADRPLTELPGIRVRGESPMRRWTIIGSTVVFIRVHEPAGVFDVTDLLDIG